MQSYMTSAAARQAMEEAAKPRVLLPILVSSQEALETTDAIEYEQLARLAKIPQGLAYICLYYDCHFLPWGTFPTSLLYARKGALSKGDCREGVPVQLHRLPLYPTLDAVVPLASKEATLDEFKQAIRDRLTMYNNPSAAPPAMLHPSTPEEFAADARSYLLVMYAAVMHGEQLFLEEDRRTMTEWLLREEELAFVRLGWHASRHAYLHWAEAALGKDNCSVSFSEGRMYLHCKDVFQLPHLLDLPMAAGDNGLRLDKGAAKAPLAVWVPSLVSWQTRCHRINLNRCLAQVRRQESPFQRDDRLTAMVQLAHDKLGMLVSMRHKPRLPGSTRAIDPIPEVDKLVEAMPKCMVKLHERATGDCPPDDYLRFEQRSVYYRFMLASGISRKALVDLQHGAHYNHPDRKKPIDNMNRYMLSLAAEVGATAKWLRKMGPAYKGDGCKALFEKGLCGYSKGSSSVGQAQRKCQQARADLLDIEETDAPTGLPLFYAQQMRKDLDAKV